MKKIYILIGSIIVLIFIFISENSVMFGFCQNVAKWGDGTKYCVDSNIVPRYIRQLGGFLSVCLLFFSLITYKMKDQVFRAWWNFARWFALIIIVSSVLLGMGVLGGGGGWGIASGLGEFVILSLLYIIFVLVSLVQIVWVYIKTMNSK